jgi:FAD/FMN-containing dehydrogenase
MSAFETELRRVVRDDQILTSQHDLETYGRDWTRVHTPNPSLVVLPESTADVRAILELCNHHKTPVVPSGGRTGLAAGAVAKDREVVLSLARMRRMDPVDVLGRTVVVEAGAVTQAVHEHVAQADLVWPVDFASKGSSTVGGNIATNAGGVRVIRYGHTRQWVLGLVVVLANGEILRLNGALEKNNTGIDLRQTFIGSEGVLGVVTEATLRLTRPPPKPTVLLFSVEGLAGVLDLFRNVRDKDFVLGAFEFFTNRCLARVMRHRKVSDPLRGASHYVLIELESAAEEPVVAWFEELLERGLVTDGTMAQTSDQARALWTLREGISESLSATGLPHKNDVALPIAKLERFCKELESVFAARWPHFEICLFGHIGDGNLHVNVMKPEDLEKAAFFARTHELDRDIFELVRAHDGSVSAEHGIGLLKKPWLEYTRSPREIEIMRELKRSLDPNHILNPGKIFD